VSSEIRARVTIKGTRSLLWHHFGPEALPLEKVERVGVAGNNPEEWRATVLVTTEGQLYLEPTYAFAAIRDGAKHTPKKRGSLQPFVAATLQVVEDRILVDRFMPENLTGDSEAPVYLDVRSVRNPSTGGRNVRYRIAASPGWACTFTILWDKTVVSRGEMESVLRDAGRLVGIGDGRSVGFGRFSIELFEVTEE
jgi:hypothetical protein